MALRRNQAGTPLSIRLKHACERFVEAWTGTWRKRWASEAALQLRAVKNAWRNHAMHGRIRYGEDDAVRVFELTKYSMQTLAGQLTE